MTHNINIQGHACGGGETRRKLEEEEEEEEEGAGGRRRRGGKGRRSGESGDISVLPSSAENTVATELKGPGPLSLKAATLTSNGANGGMRRESLRKAWRDAPGVDTAARVHGVPAAPAGRKATM